MTRRDLLVAAAVPLAPQTRQERAKKLIDEVLAALGGDRFLAMRDRIETGRVYSFFRAELSGRAQARIYTRYLTRPEPPRADFFGQRERQSFGKGKEDFAVLYAEDNAWEINFRGARPMPQPAQDRYRDSTRRNIFYLLRQRLGEPGLEMEYEAADIFENQPVETVNIIDADNRNVRVTVHRTTRLPMRQVYHRRDPKTRERFEEVTVFSKYRDAGGGVQWPFHIERSRDGEKIFEIFSDTVTLNNNLTDDLFMLSSKLKVLPPAK